jgi:hypothetical protein
MVSARDLYLDLMMRSLTDWLYDEFAEPVRAEGLDWPSRAHTMIGLKRLANVRTCVESVLAEGVPGDLIETGAWRGGTTIFMRAVLKVHGDRPHGMGCRLLCRPAPARWEAISSRPGRSVAYLSAVGRDAGSRA